MRKIVSAKILGTNKRIIGYLLDVETGLFVSTYSTKTKFNTQIALGVKQVESDSIVFLMYEDDIKGELD